MGLRFWILQELVHIQFFSVLEKQHDHPILLAVHSQTMECSVQAMGELPSVQPRNAVQL